MERIIGYYNKYGFSIMIVGRIDIGAVLFFMANQPPELIQDAPHELSLSLEQVKERCEHIGKDIAMERGSEFVGIELDATTEQFIDLLLSETNNEEREIEIDWGTESESNNNWKMFPTLPTPFCKN